MPRHSKNLKFMGRDPDLEERCRIAYIEARRLLRGWTQMARMMTRNPKLKVVLTSSKSCTDSKGTIWIKVPLELADMGDHQPDLCGKRNELKMLKCTKCQVLESVNITVIHEVAHIVHDTAEPVSPYERAMILQRAIAVECEGRDDTSRAVKLKKLIDEQADRVPDYMNLLNLVSPYLPVIWNVSEDVRVNSLMQEYRPGTKLMFEAQINDVFENGFLRSDGSRFKWSEAPPNSQATIGVYCKVSGLDYKTWLDPDVVERLDDPALDELCALMRQQTSSRAVYKLCFPLLEELRRLGFCKAPDDVEDDPPPPPEPEQEEEPEEQPQEQEPEDSQESEEQGDTSDDGQQDDEEESSGEGDSDDSDAGGSGDSYEDLDDEQADVSPEDDEGNAAGEGAEDSGEDAESDEGSKESGPGASGDDDEGGDESSDTAESEATEREDRELDESDQQDEESGTSGTEDDPEGDSSDDSSNLGDSDSESSREEDEAREGDSGESSEDSDGGSGPTEVSEGMDDTSSDDKPNNPAESDPEVDPLDPGDTEPEDHDAGQTDEGQPGDGSDDLGTGEDIGTPDSESKDSQPSGPSIPAPEPYTEEMQKADGTPDAIEELLNIFGKHEDKNLPEPDDDVKPWNETPEQSAEREQEEAIERAIMQVDNFDRPSMNIGGLRVSTYDDHTEDSPWSGRWYDRSDDNIDVEERILVKSTQLLRLAFQDNKKVTQDRHLKSGRIDRRVLARRLTTGDERLFQKKRIPGDKDYFVVVGIDCSGSTARPIGRGEDGCLLDMMKQATYAMVEMLNRLGIRNAVYAHSGDYEFCELFVIKEAEDPWGPKQKEALAKLQPYSANLDGHTLEFYRKVVEKGRETDRVIMYFTDGAMPLENFEEELAILQDEIKLCQRLGIRLVGIGVQNDDPKEHGLDTIRLDDMEDVPRLVTELRKRLM